MTTKTTTKPVNTALAARAKETALRLLARRDHSLKELKSKLRRKLKIDGNTVDAPEFERVFVDVVVALRKFNYLADEKDLAERWIRQWRSEGRGRRWITAKLAEKGLSPASQLKDDDDEFSAAEVFLKKKLGSAKVGAMGPKERAKIARSMISRGFSGSIVASLIRMGSSQGREEN